MGLVNSNSKDGFGYNLMIALYYPKYVNLDFSTCEGKFTKDDATLPAILERVVHYPQRSKWIGNPDVLYFTEKHRVKYILEMEDTRDIDPQDRVCCVELTLMEN